MTYVLVTRALSGARYFLAANNELAIQAMNARQFTNAQEAREMCRVAPLPFRDDFGTRLRGFAVEPLN